MSYGETCRRQPIRQERVYCNEDPCGAAAVKCLEAIIEGLHGHKPSISVKVRSFGAFPVHQAQ